jgi:hypothetical protein
LQVSLKSIRKLVKHEGLDGYMETSALTGGDDIDCVFHEAIRLGLGFQKEEKNIVDGKEFISGSTMTSFFDKYKCWS